MKTLLGVFEWVRFSEIFSVHYQCGSNTKLKKLDSKHPLSVGPLGLLKNCLAFHRTLPSYGQESQWSTVYLLSNKKKLQTFFRLFLGKAVSSWAAVAFFPPPKGSASESAWVLLGLIKFNVSDLWFQVVFGSVVLVLADASMVPCFRLLRTCICFLTNRDRRAAASLHSRFYKAPFFCRGINPAFDIPPTSSWPTVDA